MSSLSSLRHSRATVSPSSSFRAPPPVSSRFFTRLIMSSCLSPNRTHKHRIQGRFRSLRITNIDAAQPYDYESKLSNLHNNNNAPAHTTHLHLEKSNAYSKLKIGIVGFGNYGQFLAKTLVQQGHTVLALSRSDYSAVASKLGVSFFRDPHDLCEEHPDVILLCTSILSTKPMLSTLPFQRLKRNTLFVDVLSVKEFPRSLFLEMLPPDFDILCTHPMFGPESGRDGWDGLPFVYDKVRIGKSAVRIKRCESFIDVFRREGCRMVEMTCAEHDKDAAGSQFITHFMGRVLQNLNLESTPINTKGYESLLNLVDNTSKDSFELFYGLFLFNVNAMEQVQKLDTAFEMVKQQLFGRLHDLFREQLFESSQINGVVRLDNKSTSLSSDDLLKSVESGSLLDSLAEDGENLESK